MTRQTPPTRVTTPAPRRGAQRPPAFGTTAWFVCYALAVVAFVLLMQLNR